MARKVLISFLGTGPLESKESRTYKTANYHLNDEDLGNYPFVSAALKKHYHIDTVLLVGTVHSMWEEVYRWFCSERALPIDDDTYLEIAAACENANHSSPLIIPHQEAIEEALGKDSKVILIKYGITEEEIRENINIILSLQQYLKNGDELIVDITHSFRSLPMFMMNLLIYLQNVSSKKITISNIHYGMLEIVREIGFAPILDLKAMMDVNDWITGAYSFSEFGNAYKISELIKGQDKSVANLLDEFSNLMNLNHLYAIQKISQRLSHIRNKDYQTLLPKLTINPIVESFVNRFNVRENNHSLFQLKVARWQLDHRKFAQAMLTINEAMISYVCEINRLKWDNQNERDYAKGALSYRCSGLKCDKALKKIYKNLKPLRNSTAHSLETEKNVANMLSVLNDSVIQLESLIIPSGGTGKRLPEKKSSKQVLINFSNHPSAQWSEAQLSAAQAYGEVIDLPFPQVNPNMSEKELQALSSQYVDKILTMAEGGSITVHVMGEMTFTFLVVTRLKELGIQCVSSTTERNTFMTDDGKKVSEFKFVRFRVY